VNVVCVVRLGGKGNGTEIGSTDDFELKRRVGDLLAELAHLENGTVKVLEFRHGLPFLLETAATTSS
jgi:hypothetical protein